MKLQCMACNYVFSPKTENVPNSCPYCSKADTLEKAKSAQDWIDEVTAEMPPEN